MYSDEQWSDWSKLKPVALQLQETLLVSITIIAVGSHPLQEFGHTIDEVQDDFPESIEISTLVAGDTVTAMVDSVGFGIIKIANVLQNIKPDICLVHGDRFEAFSTAVAASLLNIVVAHIEGGELSGTVDGYIRHAVTKLSHLHFACSSDAAHRIRSMGEKPSSIFKTGCPTYERLFAVTDSSWEHHEMQCRFPGLIKRDFILAVMHPCVTEEEQSLSDFECFLSAIFTLKLKTVFLYPNVDPGNKQMVKRLHKHQKEHNDWAGWLMIHTHISPEIFAVLMREASVMVGNSSAGIRETCVFGTPTLNLGARQLGRHKPINVTTILKPTTKHVVDWIHKYYCHRYTASTEFGCHNSSKQIAGVLSTFNLSDCRRKCFSEFQHLVPGLPMSVHPVNENKLMSRIPRVLAVITARGGSKGIPGKNIAELGGQPLITYTVQAAKSSKLLDRIVLSTDSEEIAQVARRSDCEVPFIRPAHLAGDTSSHVDCMRHAINTLAAQDDYHPDYAMILQPTSPFRTGEDIDNAIRMVCETSCDAVVSVTQTTVSFEKLLHVDVTSNHVHLFVFSMPSSSYIRRQELPVLYSENGAVYLQRVDSLLASCDQRTGSLFSDDVRAYVMPSERSLDIDEPYDLEIARALLAVKRKENRDDLHTYGQ